MTGPEHEPLSSPEAAGSTEVDPARPAPRIYVASLSDYNAGRLHGEWIDASQEFEDIERAVKHMLARSPTPGAEEYAIHDHEGFGPLNIDEYLPLRAVARLAIGIAQHGAAFAAWAHGLDSVHLTDDYLDRFEEFYVGTFDSMLEFAQEQLDSWGIDFEEIGPEPLRPYIRFDLTAYARDLSYDHRIQTDPEGQVHVFNVE